MDEELKDTPEIANYGLGPYVPGVKCSECDGKVEQDCYNADLENPLCYECDCENAG